MEVPETIVDGIAAQGVRIGPRIIAQPRIAMDLRFDSNIYNRPEGESDTVAVLRPALRLASDFSRHAVRLDASAESRRYFDRTAENSDQWALSATTRLDLADRFEFVSQVGVAHRIERRGTFGDQFLTDEPVEFDELNLQAGLGRTGGTLEWQARIGTRKLDYQDASLNGVSLDQSGRDVRRDSASFRVDYRRFGRLSLFGRVAATRLRYDEGARRGSKGFSIIAGASYRITDLVTLEGGLGFVNQNARDAQQADIKALDYSLALSWTPSPRLKFDLQAERNVERSPLTFASSVLQSTIVGSSQLAIGRSNLVRLEAGLVRNDYRGADRTDSRVYAELSLQRRVIRNLAGFVAVSGRKQTASGLGARRYDGAAVRLGVAFAL